MTKRTGSRSDIQREIEEYIISRVCELLGDIELDSNPELFLNSERMYIRPDFFSDSEKIIGEIHSHIGRLKAAQQNKIAGDVLKMILFDKMRGCTYRKYIVVCGKEEYDQLNGTSYLAEAIREYEITLLYVEIPDEMRIRLQDAMKRQNLMK